MSGQAHVLRHALMSLLLAPVAGGSAMAAAQASKATDIAIGDLLARKTGAAVCFTGEFADHRVNVWDYAKATQVPVPGLFQFGEQVMRPEPAVYPDREVTSLTVLVARDGRKHESYDAMHDFRLKVILKDWQRPLYSSGECPWHAKDRTGVKANQATLYCGVECDGGDMEIERVAGSGDVVFRFNAAAGGLRMSSGCSGGQLNLGGETKPFDAAERRVAQNPVTFRLARMPNSACAAFRKATDRRE